MSEKSPDEKEREHLTHERVVALLKEDPINLAPYLAYRNELEVELPKNSIGGLQLIIMMATICLEAEFYQEAYEALDSAIMQVNNDESIDHQKREELLSNLYALIDRVPPLS